MQNLHITPLATNSYRPSYFTVGATTTNFKLSTTFFSLLHLFLTLCYCGFFALIIATKMSNEMSVLIVDDCEKIRVKLHEMIDEVDGVDQIFHAKDFDSAMLEVKANKPNVVLLDINLPGKNGFEVLKEIKNWNKKTNVIMVSNVATEYHKKMCSFLGADFFIDKHHNFESIPALLLGMQNNKQKLPN